MLIELINLLWMFKCDVCVNDDREQDNLERCYNGNIYSYSRLDALNMSCRNSECDMLVAVPAIATAEPIFPQASLDTHLLQ